MKYEKPLIEIRTGSDSDIPKIAGAYELLKSIGVPYSPRILSAHRTPEMMIKEAQKLSENVIYVSIAAAGGSAHLPGMTASETLVPVVGLPVETSNLSGQDSLYSIIQMPDGVPVGSVGIGQAKSAAILGAQIAYIDDPDVRNSIRDYRGLDWGSSLGIADEPIVGVVIPEGIGIDKEKYDGMVSLMKQFGIGVRLCGLDVTDSSGVKKTSEEMEKDGTLSVIAIGALAGEDTTNYFPRLIAESTDIPTIGLPTAKGFAGSNPNVEGDIFHNMLCYSEPEEGKITGYPVAGMGINRYTNAALFASQIAGLFFPEVQKKVREYRSSLAERVKEKDRVVQEKGIEVFLE